MYIYRERERERDGVYICVKGSFWYLFTMDLDLKSSMTWINVGYPHQTDTSIIDLIDLLRYMYRYKGT